MLRTNQFVLNFRDCFFLRFVGFVFFCDDVLRTRGYGGYDLVATGYNCGLTEAKDWSPLRLDINPSGVVQVATMETPIYMPSDSDAPESETAPPVSPREKSTSAGQTLAILTLLQKLKETIETSPQV